jgi:phospholipase C
VALFVADPGGGVFTTAGVPTRDWQNWTTVNEGVAQPSTSVTAVLTSDGRVGVFIPDPGGGVFATLGVPGEWTVWTSVAEGNAGPGTNVAAVSPGGSRFGVFVADPGGGIFANSGDPERGDFTHPVRHIFLLMMENRSFDHMLGFSDISGTDATTRQETHIEGLTGNESNPTADGKPVKVTTAAPDSLSTDPGHSFKDTLEQLCGGPGVDFEYRPGGPYPEITNQGFVMNYDRHGGVVENVMRCFAFAPNHLPVLNALAKEFAVCDHWFSSMPGPTEPNRYISLTGGCGEFDEAPSHPQIFFAEEFPGGFRFRNGANLFETLRRFGVEGRIYKRGQTTVANELAGSPRAVSFDQFRGDLEDSDFDAVGFVLIEPNYDVFGDFTDGDSQHPSGSVARGERLIKDVYETIRRSRVWERSLLIITWDKHGGFFDHVPPPVEQRFKTGDIGLTHGFVFDQLGVRVPAVVVSPLIPKNVIEHRTFDHTAIAATVRRVFKLPQFDERDGISGGVDHLATLTAARADTPLVLPNALEPVPPLSSPRPRPDAPLFTEGDSLVAAGIHSVLVQHLQVLHVEQHAATIARVRNLKTRGEAVAYVNEATQLLRSLEDTTRPPPPPPTSQLIFSATTLNTARCRWAMSKRRRCSFATRRAVPCTSRHRSVQALFPGTVSRSRF